MFLVYFGVAYGVLAMAMVAMVIASRLPHGDFRCVDGAFVAPPRPARRIFWLGLTLWLGIVSMGYLTSSVAITIRVFGIATFGSFGLLVGWAGVGAFTNRSRLIIWRDGITVLGIFTRRFTAWPDLADLPASLAVAGLGGSGLPMAKDGLLRLASLDVHPQRIIDTIGHYRDHPEARTNIGNRTELTQTLVHGREGVGSQRISNTAISVAHES
jgi:hypothetical protein